MITSCENDRGEEFEKEELALLARLYCWLDLPCIATIAHKICEACLDKGMLPDNDLLPRICAEINAVSRKLEGK